MYKYKKLVEKSSLLLSFIGFMFWVCLLGLFLSLFMLQRPTAQLEQELQKLEAEQDV
ncbi:hypothetical protein [Pseudoalteromonas nigrifaciens]|jgi:cell division protein FtsB|uniref:hypothetical protein n=1 Tax=Pseudoalteromonas nigrifaciens TaxID=28109 RepID=UPI003569AB52